jgi:hypothetical protein
MYSATGTIVEPHFACGMLGTSRRCQPHLSMQELDVVVLDSQLSGLGISVRLLQELWVSVA